MDHLATQWNLMFPPANKFVLAVGLWPVLIYEYARGMPVLQIATAQGASR